jgi:adenine-specific DNA-methyltransferase
MTDRDYEVFETPRSTPNFNHVATSQLSDLMPEVFTDGKVDFGKLRELLEGDLSEDRERFGLFWPGKKQALRTAQEPTAATLIPDIKNSHDWENTQNLFIEGDNLEVLKILQKHYHGKIRMIYIDPPYNTGKDFIYPDNYREGLATYLEWTKQVNVEGKKTSTNSDAEGRYHSNWLNMMYPRLKIARNLLTSDGIIFTSIDDNEHAHLRKIMDEIFGESNFIGTFKWNKTSKAPTLSKLMRNKYEYILAYKRSDSLELLRGVDSYNTAAPLLNSGNPFRTVSFKPGSLGFKFPNMTLGAGFYGELDKGVEFLEKCEVFDGKNKNTAKIRARFKWTQETVEKRITEGVEIYFKTPKLTTVYYSLDSEAGNFIAPSDVINDDEVGVKRNDDAYTALKDLFDGKVVFDYSKPVSLLKYLVRMIPDDSFTVLDFFSGSGTTAHAVMELNSEDGGSRKHIQIQLPEPTDEESDARKEGFLTIADISRQRIRLAGDKIVRASEGTLSSEAGSLDFGFRSYKLGDTNFTKWKVSSDIEPNKIEQHILDLRESSVDEASAEAIFCEILLKQGYSLTERITTEKINGLDIYCVSGNLVMAYLDEQVKPSLHQLKEVLSKMPAKFIILEDAFQADDELKTNLSQECKSRSIELWTA